MQKESITQAELKELLSYDPETGVFRWRCARGKAKKGAIAGRVEAKNGYIQIGLFGYLYMAHRLAVLYMTGSYPKTQIDHKNGLVADNRWCNLRETERDCLDNAQNMKLFRTSTTGYAGVCFVKSIAKFSSRICVEGRRLFLGYFDTPEEAYAARLKAQRNVWKFQPAPRG